MNQLFILTIHYHDIQGSHDVHWYMRHTCLLQRHTCSGIFQIQHHKSNFQNHQDYSCNLKINNLKKIIYWRPFHTFFRSISSHESHTLICHSICQFLIIIYITEEEFIAIIFYLNLSNGYIFTRTFQVLKKSFHSGEETIFILWSGISRRHYKAKNKKQCPHVSRLNKWQRVKIEVLSQFI